MAAAAFKGVMTLRNLNTGEVNVQPFTCTDVANAYALFTNNAGNNFIQAPGSAAHVVQIADIALSAAGTDTTQLNLRVSAKDTGVAYLNSGMVNTVNNRMPSPVNVAGGSSIVLKQLA